MRLLVTGGCGFIGSAFIRQALEREAVEILNYDSLTYAASPDAVSSCEGNPRYRFVRADICDRQRLSAELQAFRPTAVVNFAAETHVDRSIDAPAVFLKTNVLGVQALLDAAREYWGGLSGAARDGFRFLQVSTDEVFGSLGSSGAFDEDSPYRPRSPYSASKAAGDHLVMAWRHTYGLPTIISNCSNNYGPFQFPEKLIPLTAIHGLLGQSLPVYGDGSNVRDWIHVDDHVLGIWLALERGEPGGSYLFGGGGERTNLEVVQAICASLDELQPRGDGRAHAAQIEFVKDRPGHDFRYAIDGSLAREALGWQPRHSFMEGLRSTVEWYAQHRAWWQEIRSKTYAGDRLGLVAEA